jgi:hypothetical protein
MKRIIALILVASTLTACGSSKMIDGKLYSTYGLLNESTQKNDKIAYQMSVGNLILSIVFCETIIVPIILVGYDFFEPVGKKDDTTEKGVIK